MANGKEEGLEFVQNYSRFNCKASVKSTEWLIDRMIYSVNKNLGQMDFENANKLEDMENIATVMIIKCQSLKSDFDNTCFE